jgi:hypothetical protein
MWRQRPGCAAGLSPAALNGCPSHDRDVRSLEKVACKRNPSRSISPKLLPAPRV